MDLVVRGGQVVAPWGVGTWDVVVQGERIVAVAEPGSLPGDVGRVIDATGKIVVPGGIEPHAHISAPIMGMPGKETAPPDQVSRAALFGGTTTITDFAIQKRGTDLLQAIEERTSRWKGQAYCDYSHHCMMLGATEASVLPQMAEVIQQGYPTFKIFTTNIRPVDQIPENERRLVSMGHLSALLEQLRDNSGLMFIHAEDDDVV